MAKAVFFAVIFSLVILAMPNAARAQQVDQWTAIQQLQADLKADRQAVVAANLPLTEEEARAFWPAYKEYRVEVETLGDRMAKLISAYAASFETMTDTKADAFFTDLLAIDRDRVAVREEVCSEDSCGPAWPKSRALLPNREQARCHRQSHAGVRDSIGASEAIGGLSSAALLGIRKDVCHVSDRFGCRHHRRVVGVASDRALAQDRSRRSTSPRSSPRWEVGPGIAL